MLVNFSVTNFRNLDNVDLQLNPLINLFHGQNGSGKTSLLEAIYYLGLGRSFKTHLLRRIIQYNQNSFTIFSLIQNQYSKIPVGIERSLNNSKKIRIAGDDVHSCVELIKLISLQLLNQNSYLIIDEGPKIRRQLIDWGVFHVKPTYLDVWKKVETLLEQRNAALRQNSSYLALKHWDETLSVYANELHNNRKSYIDSLIPVANTTINNLLPGISINITYYPGWEITKNLDEVLESNYLKDLRYGYTGEGPHRADLKITTNNIPVKDCLSRGQQKLLIFGLQIAQGILLNLQAQKRCIYLIDDLPAELDCSKKQLLVNLLLDLQTQLIITGLDKKDLEQLFQKQPFSSFHVKQGNVTPE